MVNSELYSSTGHLVNNVVRLIISDRKFYYLQKLLCVYSIEQQRNRTTIAIITERSFIDCIL